MTRFPLFILALMGFLFEASLHAQAIQETSPPSQDQGLTQTLIMVGIFVVFFYLILWRPEQKRRKELETMRKELKKGDRVTAMGIRGIVSKVTDDAVILRMIDGAKIEFVKAAITEIEASKEGSTEPETSSD